MKFVSAAECQTDSHLKKKYDLEDEMAVMKTDDTRKK